jgi:NAD+-dependent protein deacetylase sirtuin 2
LGQFGTSLHNKKEEEILKKEAVLDELSVQGIVRAIHSGKCKNIIVMTGAGESLQRCRTSNDVQ